MSFILESRMDDPEVVTDQEERVLCCEGNRGLSVLMSLLWIGLLVTVDFGNINVLSWGNRKQTSTFWDFFLCNETMPLGLKPCCAVCKTNSSSMWKKGNQGEILCNNCTAKSNITGASGLAVPSNTQQSNGGGKQVCMLCLSVNSCYM